MRARRWIKLGLVAITLLIAAGFFYHYTREQARYPATEDAYIGANVTRIAPQVSGPVLTLAVQQNQRVRRGQLLFTIDPAPFQLAVVQAQAALNTTRQSYNEAEAALHVAEAQLAQNEVQAANAARNAARVHALAQQQYLSRAQDDDARTAARAAAVAVRVSQARVTQARQALAGAGPNALQQQREATLKQARLDLGYTQVYAPTDGVIAGLTLRPGTMVSAAQPVFAIVNDRDIWVDANYKETALYRIHPGQPADIHLDIYPNHDFHGVVESISGGSGAAFSLLPPENATGNWVKVVQRVPVRVHLANPDPRLPLPIGTSASVSIDTGPLTKPWFWPWS